MDALLEQLRIADSSGVDFLYDEYLFIWEAVLLNKWTGLSEEQEEKVVATVLGIRGSIIEGAPVVMADLFIVSHLVDRAHNLSVTQFFLTHTCFESRTSSWSTS